MNTKYKQKLSIYGIASSFIGVVLVIFGNNTDKIDRMYPVAIGDLLVVIGVILAVISYKNIISILNVIVILLGFLYSYYDFIQHKVPSGKEMLDKYNLEHPR